MVAELTALRDQIDEVDKALLSLLAKRLELVAEVGEVKSQYGLPIYVPERESAMLASRREEAAALGVPPPPTMTTGRRFGCRVLKPLSFSLE